LARRGHRGPGAEPLADEGAGESSGFGVVEHAVNLRGKNFGVLKAALGGQSGEFVVRTGGPEEVGKTGGKFKLADRIDAGPFVPVLHLEQKVGGNEDGPEG
jgi:hypothetical protein